MGNSEKLIIMLSRMEWKSRKAQGVQGEALQLKIYINKNNMNLIFRTAGAEDLSEIISLLADDELGQNKEDFRLPIPEAYIGETENLFK
ncbi:hypothetical protein D3C87_1662710 [compost metagenome]